MYVCEENWVGNDDFENSINEFEKIGSCHFASSREGAVYQRRTVPRLQKDESRKAVDACIA